jgi:hypothetical protein
MSVQFKTVDEFAVGQRLDNYLLKHLKGVPKSHIYSNGTFLATSRKSPALLKVIMPENEI